MTSNTCLSALLAPLSIDEFLQRYGGTFPCQIKGPKDKYCTLLDWASLNKILNGHPFPHPAIRIYFDGKPLSTKTDLDVLSVVQQGATLIFENIDRYHHGLGSYLDSLSAEIGNTTRFNLYLSPPGHQGYRRHYDTHDFLILQIEGSKDWKIFPATSESPLFYQKKHDVVPPKEEDLLLNCTLEKGDILYVPRGFWHEATSIRESSLHLTLAVFPVTGIDFLDWVVDELREDALWRSEFAFGIERKREHDLSPSTNEVVEKHLEELKDSLSQYLENPELLHDFRRHHFARYRSRQRFSFPDQLESTPAFDPDTVFETVRRPTLVSQRNMNNTVEVVDCGLMFEFPIAVAPLLQFIFSEQGYNGNDLLVATALTWKQVSDVLLPLVRAGLLKITQA